MCMYIVLSVYLSLIIKFTYAACPNFCNGHGSCGQGNVCKCFDGWNGGAADCSFRELIYIYH